MIIFKSINNLNKKIKSCKNLGFVPTMGSLHDGHISLIQKSKKKSKKTLVSIFINPNQFNNKKDYKTYPRNIANDLKILKRYKVDYVLIPKTEDVYSGKKNFDIAIKKSDKILCAKFRPGHFEGVLSVINQFLKKINIEYIFLGEKDYQQLHLIKKYLGQKFKTKIIGCKTIRYKNSFAYSSRNYLLSKSELLKLKLISKIMLNFRDLLKKNFKNKKKINVIKNNLILNKIKIEYLEIRNKKDLNTKTSKKNFKIFFAFYINNIRFIDNY